MPYSLASTEHPRVETEIKRSRFIAELRRAEDIDVALQLLADARAAHPSARHHCFACVIGDADEARIERSSDDGEPGGTAGIPMLQVLKSRDIVNVAAVVIRYFGGVKLGAGGLVRAYSGAVAAAVDAATLIPRVRHELFRLTVDHADAGRLEAELRGRGIDVPTIDYAERATLTVSSAHPAELASTIAALTGGQAQLVPAGHVWT
ncbi:IMPACT family protein [Hoyosella sp. YIM 151337]|uniref:IMPACT family protein n=1 Tax=Hoyosella sp. YIM 151337 TaxID=2992742 RepID=UPI00223555FE|nr:YigZ family protein [Hoyosella sp. YIM 151337]MCW4354850.1 IMPACT family protein [Hoyosella sp. YIM 151337]